jgi:hypothetical protein
MEEFDQNKNSSYYYNKYVEYYNKYYLLNSKNEIKAEKQRKASYQYALKKKLNTFKTCNDCNISLSSNSFNNHLKSQKHLKTVELQTKIKELQK